MERTFAIIKPDAMASGHAHEIIAIIKDHGFTIVGKEQRQLSRKEVEEFYAEHKERSFFPEVVAFMISGPVTLLALEKENAVKGWRDLMGATDPAQASEGTIRKTFGRSKGNNATHGSDSPLSAARELAFFFPNL